MPYSPNHRLARLLVVDDDTAATLLARLAIEESELEAEVETAGGVQETRALLYGALEQPSRTLPDLVLLDLNLRDGSGHDLLGMIKAEPRLSALPVVILSTSSDPYDIQRSLDAGAQRYIVKPADFGEFVDAMSALRSLLSAESSA